MYAESMFQKKWLETIKANHSPSIYDCPQSQGSNALFLTKKAHSNSLIEKFLWDHLNKCENGRKSWGKTLCPLNANCSHCAQDFKTETLCLVLHLAQNGRASIVQARGAILYSMICYTPCIIVWIIMFCKASQKNQPRAPHIYNFAVGMWISKWILVMTDDLLSSLWFVGI